MATTATTTGNGWRRGFHIYSEAAMRNLASRQYKYTGIDLSPIALYILHPFWNRIVKLVPRFIAANLLTVMGGVFFVSGYLLLFWYNPEFTGTRPQWVYLYCALMTFLYQTMDGIDGKHARATNTPSPLGEMLDHGVDVLWCTFGATSLVAAAQIGANFWLFGVVVLGVIVPFYVVTWESYHTHKMVLGYVNGPTEGLLLVTVVFTLLGIYGPAGEAVCTSPVAPYLARVPGLGAQLLPYVPPGLTVIQSVVVLMALAVAYQIFTSTLAVLKAQREQRKPVGDALLLIVPQLVLAGAATAWVLLKPQVLASAPHRVVLLLGHVFANLTVRLITGHLMHQQPRVMHVPTLLVPLAIAATALLRLDLALQVLTACTAIAMVYHYAYMVMMVRDFTQFLNIKLFGGAKRD